jgi:hypothetical protein
MKNAFVFALVHRPTQKKYITVTTVGKKAFRVTRLFSGTLEEANLKELELIRFTSQERLFNKHRN